MTTHRLSGKSARRLRIRANHMRIKHQYADYLLGASLADGLLTYGQWLHSDVRRKARGRPVPPHRSGGGLHVS